MTPQIKTIIVLAIVFVTFSVTLGVYIWLLKSRSQEFENSKEKTFGTLQKVLWIFGYPVYTIIEFFFGITCRMYMAVYEAFRIDYYKKEKTQRIIRNAISSVMHTHSNLLNSYLNRRVARTLTFLLQLVSFITTYAGFVFFLGQLNPVAPLFMAITVQGCCYYLLNYSSTRKRTGAWKRIFLLVVLIITSASTSYIGIFDCVVQPVEKMKTQYTEYVYRVNDLIDRKLDQEKIAPIQQDDVEQAIKEINEVASEAQNTIDRKSKTAAEYIVASKSERTTTDEEGHTNTSIEVTQDVDANNNRADLIEEIDLLRTLHEKLQNYLDSAPEIDSIMSAYNSLVSETPTDDSAENNTTIDQFYAALSTALKLSNQISYSNKEKVEAYSNQFDRKKAIANNKALNELESLRPVSFDDAKNPNDDEQDSLDNDALTQEESLLLKSGNASDDKFWMTAVRLIHDTVDKLNAFVVSEDSTRAIEIRNALNDHIEKNYSELAPKFSENEADELETAKKNAIIENPQVMPFVLPFKDQSLRGEAIFSAIVAVLIDVFSALIAFALVNKKKSILYFTKVGDLRAQKEEMIEDCLMYICLRGLQSSNQNNSKNVSRPEIKKYVVKKINCAMRDFMQKVHLIYLSDELNSFGYISGKEVEGFSEDNKNIFLTLCNAALIHPCYNTEIIKIIDADFVEAPNNGAQQNNPKANAKLIQQYDSAFSKDDIYYLVSKNLHAWYCENFSELLQNSLLFTVLEDVTSLSDDQSDLNDNGGQGND